MRKTRIDTELRRSRATSQAVAGLSIGARGGPRHHSATAKP